MIQPLRTYHRWTVELMGIFLPVIFLAGLAARPSATKANQPEAAITHTIYKSKAAWKVHEITTTVSSGGELQLVPASELKYPDLLLYWSPDASRSFNTIGANAKLLGAFDPSRRYRLPEDWRRGSLLLYSLAQQKMVDVATFDKLP